jgi:hypothetical protein
MRRQISTVVAFVANRRRFDVANQQPAIGGTNRYRRTAHELFEIVGPPEIRQIAGALAGIDSGEDCVRGGYAFMNNSPAQLAGHMPLRQGW